MKNCFTRQLIVGGLALILSYLFFLSRGQWDPMHAWNRAFGDVSLLFLSVIMLLGTLSKIFKSLTKWLVWRRELGVWTGVTAIVHIIIILDGWIQWQMFRLFFVFSNFVADWVLHPGFALGNILGIVALVYVLILMVTSNDLSIKLMGNRAWSYVQQRAHIFYVLVVLHTSYFLYLHNPEAPNWLRTPFIILITFIWLTHLVAFFVTISKNSQKIRA
ncbi:MAG: ferric reductase-like transmembrane domain-containing protein [Bacillaceae bacterium]|nr:ferric reductase-like transmembrane domain-containing protein [Bacillaceae bacterium]